MYSTNYELMTLCNKFVRSVYTIVRDLVPADKI